MTANLPVVRDGSGAMFDAIAKRYDLLNRVISLGTDQGWRRETVRALELQTGDRVLDLATGTADLAIQIARNNPGVTVLGVDPSRNMLDVGVTKVARLGLSERVELVEGDAQQLDLEDASVDKVCMAFGIRNVPDRGRALREMARVTRPGGRIAILELGEPRHGFLAPFARFHIHHVVPFLGGLISGHREYSYLQKSIADFPSPTEFANAMRASGLDVLSVRPFTFGVSCLFVGTPSLAS